MLPLKHFVLNGIAPRTTELSSYTHFNLNGYLHRSYGACMNTNYAEFRFVMCLSRHVLHARAPRIVSHADYIKFTMLEYYSSSTSRTIFDCCLETTILLVCCFIGLLAFVFWICDTRNVNRIVFFI